MLHSPKCSCKNKVKMKTGTSEVGISEIAGVVPEWSIKAEKMAKDQQLPLEYVNGGLGLIRARIPYNTPLEELIIKALQKIHYQDVDRFILATESDNDLSKAIIAIKAINKGLNITKVPFQLKFACLAGVQALLLACEYSIAHKKPAIVIVADRSLYGDDKAQVTQGSAVIAIRIENNPKLLTLQFRGCGQYAEDIEDFRVPVKTAPFPEINGPLTKPAYIKCMIQSVKDYKIKNQKSGLITDEIDYFVMHTPFPKMVVWASAALWRYERNRNKEFLPLLEQCLYNPDLFKRFKEFLDETRKLPEFQKFFKQKVEPGLRYNLYIGNCYNASIFISLISVLEQIEKGQHLCIIGYGSGSGSLTMMGQAVKSGFYSDLNYQIKNGKELSVAQYQEWRAETVKKVRGD